MVSRRIHRPVPAGALVLIAVTAVVVLLGSGGLPKADPTFAQPVGTVDNVSIDMDPAGSTPTSVGSIEPCAEVVNNNVLDADEDGVVLFTLGSVSGSTATTVTVAPNPGWTVDAYVGHEVAILFPIPENQVITSNTADTITVAGWAGAPPGAGSGLEIHALDSVLADVVVHPAGIPPSPPDGGLVAFQYYLNFVDGGVEVISADSELLIDSLPGAIITNLSDFLPDAATPWLTAVVNLAVPPYPTGPGQLTQLLLEGVGPGAHPLSLTGVEIMDGTTNLPYPVDNIPPDPLAVLAVDQPCPAQSDVKLITQTVTFPSSIDTSEDVGAYNPALVEDPLTTPGQCDDGLDNQGLDDPIPPLGDGADAADSDCWDGLAIEKTIHNNGPDPVAVNITKTITLPADCTVNGLPGPVVVIPDSAGVVDVSVDQIVTYNEMDVIHCSERSDHQIEVENCIAPDSILPDLDPSNNCDIDVVNFIATGVADAKIQSQTISAPGAPVIAPLTYPRVIVTYDPTLSEDGAGPNTCANNIDDVPDGAMDELDPDCYVGTQAVDIDKVLHNNGPYGPVDVAYDAAGAFAPNAGGAWGQQTGDCAVTPVVPGGAASLPLPISTTVPVTENFTIQCNLLGMGNDTDGDTLIDEDTLDGLDDDLDGPIDEDSPYQIAVFCFVDTVTVTGVHVTDPDLSNNTIDGATDPAQGCIVLAILRDFNPTFTVEQSAADGPADPADLPVGDNCVVTLPCEQNFNYGLPAGEPHAGATTAERFPAGTVIIVPGDGTPAGDYYLTSGFNDPVNGDVPNGTIVGAGILYLTLKIGPGTALCSVPVGDVFTLEDGAIPAVYGEGPDDGSAAALFDPNVWPTRLEASPLFQAFNEGGPAYGTTGGPYDTNATADYEGAPVWSRATDFIAVLGMPINRITFNLGASGWAQVMIPGDPSVPPDPFAPQVCSPSSIQTDMLGETGNDDTSPGRDLRVCNVINTAPGHMITGEFERMDTGEFTQVVEMETCSTATYTLTLTTAGTGTGTVKVPGDGSEINCSGPPDSGDCTEVYAVGTPVTLTATPDSHSAFGGWSGDADCSDGSVTMNGDKTCTATFTPDNHTLTVVTAGSGSGTVKAPGDGSEINCSGPPDSGDCTEVYVHGTGVGLTATADGGSAFAGWSGDADCSDGSVTMDSDKSCTATFGVDADGDTIADLVDNCPATANGPAEAAVLGVGNQTDSDGDGVPGVQPPANGTFGGDACDVDDDNDGIADSSDGCRVLAEDFDGFADADGCPDPDNDFDGICDPGQISASCTGSDSGYMAFFPPPQGGPLEMDCRNIPEDYDGFHDGDGCPEPDNDNDGFPDSTDQCPGTDIHSGADGALGPPEDLNHNGIQDGGEAPFTTDDVVLVFEDYDGVLDTDGCHDSPGDDFDGDGLTDDDEVFVYGSQPYDPDTDGDGIEDGVDGQASRGEDAVAASVYFTDRPVGTTFGRIVSEGGTTLSVSDDAVEGVRIVVSGSLPAATVVACDSPEVTYTLTPGDHIIPACGSATTEVIEGPVETAFGSITANQSSQTTLAVVEVAPGEFEVTSEGTSGSTIDVGGLPLDPGETVQVSDADGDGLVNQADADDDNDLVADVDEGACGADQFDDGVIPERVDGAFALTDDDQDGEGTTEELPAGSEGYDCDGDGYPGADEARIYGTGVSTTPDQDPCGNDGWPSELFDGLGSENKINLQDVTSFVMGTPPFKFGSVKGGPGYDERWNLFQAGASVDVIDLQDITAILTGPVGGGGRDKPPMLGGATRTFDGPSCPWPP